MSWGFARNDRQDRVKERLTLLLFVLMFHLYKISDVGDGEMRKMADAGHVA